MKKKSKNKNRVVLTPMIAFWILIMFFVVIVIAFGFIIFFIKSKNLRCGCARFDRGNIVSENRVNNYGEIITVRTDKTEYEVGEEIKITVNNYSKDNLSFSGIFLEVDTGRTMEVRDRNGNAAIPVPVFEKFTTDVNCCYEESLFFIAANSEEEYKWNQRIDPCGCLPYGEKIRLSVRLLDDSEGSTYFYSNELEIRADVKNDDNLELIGNYSYNITSMCSQNCESFYLGSYKLTGELEGLKGINRDEIVWSRGDMVKDMELPTVAGPDSVEKQNSEMVETVEFQPDCYQKIEFLKISVSKPEIVNYLDNEDSRVDFEFKNPLNKDLNFKFRVDDLNDFQYVSLKPKETKSVQYIYKKDNNLESKRDYDDIWDLVVINDFVSEGNYKRYYFEEAKNLDSSGIMIYIDEFIELQNHSERSLVE